MNAERGGLLLAELGWSATLFADSADEALRDDADEGGRDEEVGDAEVLESGDRARGIVRVERREDEVSRERGLDGHLRGLGVSDFTQHDDVGVLTEDVAQDLGEGQADLGVDERLVEGLVDHLDGVLDGRDVDLGALERAEAGVEGRRLP